MDKREYKLFKDNQEDSTSISTVSKIIEQLDRLQKLYVELNDDFPLSVPLNREQYLLFKERASQPLNVNQIHPNDVSSSPIEIIRRTEDDEIWINIDNIDNIDNFDLRAIKKDIDKELVKIHPSIFLISHSGSNISFEKFDKGKRAELTIGFSFIYRKSLTESIPYTMWQVFPSDDDGFIKFYPHKVAKHFSERTNEFALQHASK